MFDFERNAGTGHNQGRYRVDRMLPENDNRSLKAWQRQGYPCLQKNESTQIKKVNSRNGRWKAECEGRGSFAESTHGSRPYLLRRFKDAAAEDVAWTISCYVAPNLQVVGIVRYVKDPDKQAKYVIRNSVYEPTKKTWSDEGRLTGYSFQGYLWNFTAWWI